jgi:hypothetical protein
MKGASGGFGPPFPQPRSSSAVFRFHPARLASLLALALLTLFVGSCSNTHHLNIESDTCWLMVIDGQTEAVTRDCLNANFKIIGGFHCVRVTNLGPTGTVRIRVDGGPWTAKVAPNEVAESCSH